MAQRLTTFLFLLAIALNAYGNHDGVKEPVWVPDERTIVFPCHGSNAMAPIGVWVDVHSPEEVYYIMGMFTGEIDADQAEEWVARTKLLTLDMKILLLDRTEAHSIYRLYQDCALPYLEEHST